MKHIAMVAVGAILLSACAGPAPRKPAPVDERVVSGAQREAPREELGTGKPPEVVIKPLPEPDQATPRPVNPAVVALLDSAGRQSGSGEYEQAAASLERALAIDPRNAWLWHRLAQVRLKQGRLDQAAGLAAKSNTLATGNLRLISENWRLIAEVRERQGDHAGAQAAAARAGAPHGR